MRIFFAFFCLHIAFFAQAQEDDKPAPFKRPEQSYAKDTVNPNRNFQAFKPKSKVDFSKFIIEPNIQFSLSNTNINIGLAPYVGYRVWKGLAVGAGGTYFYSRVTYQYGNPKYVYANNHTYGLGVFAQYTIYKGLFARVRTELLWRKYFDYYSNKGVQLGSNGNITSPIKVANYPILFIGAGYNLLRSKNIFVPILFQYNVLQSFGDKRYSPYPHGFNLQIAFINIF